MNIDLSRKTALVTGPSKGIGFGIAHGLARAGATVIAHGRTQTKVDTAVARVGGSARVVVADRGSIEGYDRLVAAVPTADIVISNLNIFKPTFFFETDDASWD